MNQKQQRENRWREMCTKFRESGMSRRAFCESREIPLSTLGYWLKRFAETPTVGTTSEFVPVGTIAVTRSSVLRIRLGERVIVELDLPADESVIQTMLRAAASL